jgi:catechol 2,3-dioxygenase-like lactoylglutathione lyase family enzyme
MKGNIPILKVLETCLYVQDLDRTRQFYEHVLGLHVVAYTPGRHVFFRAGESMLLCFLPDDSRAQQNLPEHWGQGHLHFAFQVPAGAAYDAAKIHLEQQRIRLEHEEFWPSGQRSVYFRDPDLNCVELAEQGLWGLP